MSFLVPSGEDLQKVITNALNQEDQILGKGIDHIAEHLAKTIASEGQVLQSLEQPILDQIDALNKKLATFIVAVSPVMQAVGTLVNKLNAGAPVEIRLGEPKAPGTSA